MDPSSDRRDQRGAAGSGVIFGIVALALIAAIGLFFLVDDRPSDRNAEAIGHAAEKMDDAARSVGDAAQKAAKDLRPRD